MAVLFLGLFFSFSGKASAATYYVSTTEGDDTNCTGLSQTPYSSGSSQPCPYKTMIKAETAASTGDTVYVKTGTYVEPSTVGGSTGNITFTKGLIWIGKSADWSTDGIVTVRGATATTGNTVAGNTNVLSMTNFIFDGQGVGGGFTLNSGQANKSFINCTFQGVNAASYYGVWVRGGSVVNFASSTFSYGSSANSLFFLSSGASLNITGTATSHSSITTTGANAMTVSATSNVTLTNTDITVTNPVTTVIVESTAGSTAALSMTGGSINVTGGNHEVIYWSGGVSIDGTTINVSGVSNFLDNPGTYASTSIANANVSISSSGYLVSTNGGISTSLNISSSTLNINGSGRILTSGSSSLTLNNNDINAGASFSISTLISNGGSGATTVTNNRMNISSGALGTLVYKSAASRTVSGDFNFSNNNLQIAIDYTSNLIYVNYFDGNLTINNNVITATSDSAWSHSNAQYLIYMYDVPNPAITNNTIKTYTSGANEHISILSSDSNWTGTGIATITGNTHYSNSGSGHIIDIGADGLTDLSKAQKWNGSIIRNNTIYGPGSGWDGTPDTTNYATHDIFVGHNINCDVAYNKIIGGNLAFVIKDYLGMVWTSGGVHDNIVINPTYGGILSKGAQNLNIYNNSFYANSTSANSYMVGIGEKSANFPTTGNNVFNNIIYGVVTRNLVDVDAYSTTNFRAYNNVYWNNTGSFLSQKFTYNGSNVTGFSAWNSAIGGGDTSILSDPNFTDIANNDVTLQSTSPAINTGITVSGRTTDSAGLPVPSGPLPDIGAYEFQDSTKPTTSADIVSGTYNSVQLVTLACDDGVGVGCDKTYYTLTGIDPTTSSTIYSGAISISDNTTTILKFFSRDKNENSETPIKSKTYTIDTIFPETTIDSNPGTLINTNSASFTFSASETATFQCKLDSGAYASCSTPKNYTSLSEGSHTFYVKATDTATSEDATPASYTFTVDTEVPIISDLSPNNTTLPVTTTSTNLTITTSETTTCKYSTTSGTSYASMTAFDSTNNTTHSTAIAGLNSGTTYNYYIKCKDAINESAEEHLTFSIAPEENKTSLNSIKIKIERETNKFKDKIYSWKNKFKLKGDDSNLVNGTVKIYKDGKRIETVDVGSDGVWSQMLKLKDDFSGWIKIRQYDQFGTLLSTDKAKIKVDTEDPKFNEVISQKMTIGRNQKIQFTATDDNSGIDYYKVKLSDIRDWRQQNEDFYQIPEDVPNGTYDLFIRAYDKTGNYAEEKTTLNVIRFKNSINLTQVPLNFDSPTQNTESQIQNNTDKNTDVTPSNSNSNNSPSPQSQSQPSTFKWYNPFSWF